MQNNNKFAKIASLDKTVKIGNQKEEWYNKMLSCADFTKTRNGMEEVRAAFDFLWLGINRLLGDNEILLDEQRITLKNYANLDEKYKKLVIEHGALMKVVEDYNESVKPFDGQSKINTKEVLGDK